MEREHFRYCISVKALVNATMIAGGRKESATNDLTVQQVDFYEAFSGQNVTSKISSKYNVTIDSKSIVLSDRF